MYGLEVNSSIQSTSAAWVLGAWCGDLEIWEIEVGIRCEYFGRKLLDFLIDRGTSIKGLLRGASPERRVVELS